MHEPVVALSDFAIAAECALIVGLLARRSAVASARSWWMLLFASVGVASTIGGMVHGFVPDTTTVAYQVLWKGTLLTLGVTSLATWVLGARLMLPDGAQRPVVAGAAALLALYAVVVTTVSDRFAMALAMYLPATTFLSAAVIREHVRNPSAGWSWAIAGFALTFVAGAVQQARLVVHPVWFDHNVLYHTLQAIALWLIYRGQAGVRGHRARRGEAAGPQND